MVDRPLTVYLHRGTIDFRKNINGLSALVEHELHLDPFAHAVYVFGNDRTALCRRRGNMVTRKVLTWRNKDNMQVAGVIGRMFDELDSFEQPSKTVVDVIGHRQVFCTFAPKVVSGLLTASLAQRAQM